MNSRDLEKKIVGHILWGKGTVVECVDGKIKIEFSGEEKTFLYPSAFEKYLTFEDNDAQLQVQQFIIDEKEKLEKKKREEISKIAAKKADNHISVRKPKEPKSSHSNKAGFKYSDWEATYPDHVIIQKEGFMYQAHNESAEELSEVLDYELMTDIAGRITTGGPDAAKIGVALEAANCSYIIVESEQIVDRYDAQ